MVRYASKMLIFIVAILGFGCVRHPDDLASGSLLAPATPAPLPDMKPLLHRLATQDGCQDVTTELRLSFVNEEGRREEVSFRLQRKYAPDRISTLLTVLSPQEETEKALLAIEQEGKRTEAFSYLAGLKRLTRLGSSSQLSFRGSKITVQELLGLELNQYEVEATTRAGGADQGLIRVKLVEKFDRGLAFPRLIAFFQESEQRPARFELYSLNGDLVKTVKVEEVKQIQGYQTLTGLAIEDHKQSRALKLETSDIKYDRQLPETLFTQAHLIKIITQASRKLMGVKLPPS